MGRPKKVKVKETKTTEEKERKIWKQKHELDNDYEYELQEYAWGYEALEQTKKDLEKALKAKIEFEKEHEAILNKNK